MNPEIADFMPDNRRTTQKHDMPWAGLERVETDHATGVPERNISTGGVSMLGWEMRKWPVSQMRMGMMM